MFAFTLLAVATFMFACGGNRKTNNAVPTATFNGDSITTLHELVVTFSTSMNTDSVQVTGSLGDASNGGTWSMTDAENDTLTLSPNLFCDASQIGTLTINGKDINGISMNETSATYGVVLTLSNFMNASVVIGQADFTSNSVNQGGSAVMEPNLWSWTEKTVAF